MGAPRIISLHTILGPPDHFFRLLYGAPQICFFSYKMGAPLRSVSLITIWDPPPPLRSVSLHAIGGGGHLTFRFFSQNIWGPPQISFSAYYMGPHADQFLCILFGGPSQISFFSYYMGPLSDQFFLLLYGAPSDQFLRILYGGGALRSVSSPTIYGGLWGDQFFRLLYEGPPQISFFAYYMGVSLHTI